MTAQVDWEALLSRAGEPLFSRRNQVTLLEWEGERYIRKRYPCPETALQEANALRLLARQGLAVPTLLYHRGDTLLMGCLLGQTYEQLIGCDAAQALQARAAAALAAWTQRFCLQTGGCRADQNLRNFLFTTEEICVGLDFEDAPIAGDLTRSLGVQLAFAASYDPAFVPEKQGFCGALLRAGLALGADQAGIRSAYLAELFAMRLRRERFFYCEKQALDFFCRLEKDDGR